MASGGWKTATISRHSGWTSTARAKRQASSRATCWSPLMGDDVSNVGSLERQIYRTGVWSKATYSLVRQGIPIEAPLILVPADRSLYIGLRLIALVYLGIGLYVLLRRWTAPKSTHFYVFCLVSFIFYSFHYTGKLNDFDWIIYWANVVAWLLQPALFLHFSLTFPERQPLLNRTALADSRGLCAGRADPGDADRRSAMVAAQRDAALQPRPTANGLSGGLLRGGDVRAVAQLSPCGFSHPATADEVGDARNHSRRRSVHAVLRHSLPVRRRAYDWHAGVGAVAGVPAAHVRLRHLPLSPDGRGPDLQARHGIHHRGWRDHGGIFRCGRRGSRSSSTRASPAPARSGW